MNKKGLLIVLSGFSGCGKGTVMKALLEQYPEEFSLSVSATTRAPRLGEQEGVAYFFKTKEEFEALIAEDALLEYANYVGNYYGTPKAYVQTQLNAGKNVFLEIEMQGALKVKEAFPETFLMFLVPPSIPELISRLEGRGTETGETVHSRMAQALEELKVIPRYDCVVVNNDIAQCVADVYNIVKHPELGKPYTKEQLDDLEEQLRRYLKGDKS